jgi:hypothetical protein
MTSAEGSSQHRPRAGKMRDDHSRRTHNMPALSLSLLLIAVGAILVWGVSVAVEVWPSSLSAGS